jgi:hypothetical protein
MIPLLQAGQRHLRISCTVFFKTDPEPPLLFSGNSKKEPFKRGNRKKEQLSPRPTKQTKDMVQN